MAKILLTGDVHLHNHKNSDERLQHCLEVLEWVFRTAEEKEIEHICFLGDLFHSRQKINVATYQWTFEIFCKWMKTGLFDVYLLVGNHDMVHKFKPDICSIKPLASIEGVHIVDKPCFTTMLEFEVDNQPVAFLPYSENPLNDLQEIKGSPKNLLLGHVALMGASLNSVCQSRAEAVVEHDGDMTVVDADSFKDWKRVFLGHYHGAQKIGNIEYVGSPLQLSFGEAFQEKHLIIYNTETDETEYVVNDFSPQHLIISQQDISQYDLTNNFVRIMVDDISSAELVEFRNEILEKDVGSLDIRQKHKKEQDSQAVDDALSVVLHNDLIIEKYVDTMADLEELHGLDRDRLLAIGQKIIEDVNNKLNQ